jgi:hypothetical protein
MDVTVRYRALLERWVRAFRPERIWVNGEGLWECPVCGMSSDRGPRSILHSERCLWAETNEAIKAERGVLSAE